VLQYLSVFANFICKSKNSFLISCLYLADHKHLRLKIEKAGNILPPALIEKPGAGS